MWRQRAFSHKASFERCHQRKALLWVYIFTVLFSAASLSGSQRWCAQRFLCTGKDVFALLFQSALHLLMLCARSRLLGVRAVRLSFSPSFISRVCFFFVTFVGAQDGCFLRSQHVIRMRWRPIPSAVFIFVSLRLDKKKRQ